MTDVSDDLEECYRDLEVAPWADKDEVKRAYRLLAHVWHPDRFTHNEGFRQQAEARLKKINAAYRKIDKAGFPSAPAPLEAQPPDALFTACPWCGTQNRLSSFRLSDEAQCGACRQGFRFDPVAEQAIKVEPRPSYAPPPEAPPEAPTPDVLVAACPWCGTQNRLSWLRLGDEAQCGACRQAFRFDPVAERAIRVEPTPTHTPPPQPPDAVLQACPWCGLPNRLSWLRLAEVAQCSSCDQNFRFDFAAARAIRVEPAPAYAPPPTPQAPAAPETAHPPRASQPTGYSAAGGCFIILVVFLFIGLLVTLGNRRSPPKASVSITKADPAAEAFQMNELGNQFAARSDWPEAARYYERALSLQPNDAVVLENLGSAYYSAGQFAFARRTFMKALGLEKREEKRTELLLWLAATENAAGQFPDALETARQAVRLSPRTAEAHYWRAVALANLGRPAEAMSDIDIALQLKPGDASATQLRERLTEALRVQTVNEAPARAADRPMPLKPTRDVVKAPSQPAQAAVQAEVPRPLVTPAPTPRPATVDAWDAAGIALLNAGRHREAVRVYREAYREHPVLQGRIKNLVGVLKDSHPELAFCLDPTDTVLSEALTARPDQVRGLCDESRAALQ